jgi:hypothetical protein
MRICAAIEKIGCSGGKILYTTREANVLKLQKFTITTTIPRNFCELGKRTKEYLKKINKIASKH